MAKTFRTTIRGTNEVKRNLLLLGDKAPQVAALVLTEEAETVMSASKQEVPVRDGILRGTGHVEPPVVSGSIITVAAAYGGPAAPYAARQHEHTEYKHTVGKAKYLSDPFNARRDSMPKRAGERMAGILIGSLP